jgi:DNA-binding GntR family transcriptional regulator
MSASPPAAADTTPGRTIDAAAAGPTASVTPAAADRAYRHVKARLLDGSYPDGHLLSEGEVAADLDMSRTPVREAFLRLQAEGFLRLYPKRGALVVPVSAAEAQAVLEARLALESFAIDKLAAAGSQALREIGAALAELPATNGGSAGARRHEADRDFHARLVAAAGNPIVADFYDTLRDRQLRITATAVTRPGDAAGFTDQHGRIAAALADGDAEGAKRLLREHLRDAVRALGFVGGPLLDQPER